MGLNPYQRFAYKRFRNAAARAVERNPHLGLALQKAHLALRPDVYWASAVLTAVLAGLAVAPVVLLLGLARWTGTALVPDALLLVLVFAPFLLPVMVYVVALALPDLRARGRARDIDAKLPYALNYISTMSAAGTTPDAVFISLSKQSVYGEVANEAAWIVRDLKVLGLDILTALIKAIDRTPSLKFQDLLQGAVTTLQSGGDVGTYFLTKADQFLQENRQEQKGFLESLGVLAESFVTVVVAGPLFIIILLSVMTSLGTEAEQVLLIGYVLVLIVIPAAQAGFAYAVRLLTPEA